MNRRHAVIPVSYGATIAQVLTEAGLVTDEEAVSMNNYLQYHNMLSHEYTENFKEAL